MSVLLLGLSSLSGLIPLTSDEVMYSKSNPSAMLRLLRSLLGAGRAAPGWTPFCPEEPWVSRSESSKDSRRLRLVSSAGTAAGVCGFWFFGGSADPASGLPPEVEAVADWSEVAGVWTASNGFFDWLELSGWEGGTSWIGVIPDVFCDWLERGESVSSTAFDLRMAPGRAETQQRDQNYS